MSRQEFSAKESAVIILSSSLENEDSGMHRSFSEFFKHSKLPFKAIAISFNGNSSGLERSREFAFISKEMPEVHAFDSNLSGQKCLILQASFSKHQLQSMESRIWKEFGIRLDGLSDDKKQEILSNAIIAEQLPRIFSEKYNLQSVDAIGFENAIPGVFLKNAFQCPMLYTFQEFDEIAEKSALNSIECIALMECDFATAFTRSFLKTRFYELLPLKEQIERDLSKSLEWRDFQVKKNEDFRKFLLLEDGNSAYASSCNPCINLVQWRNSSLQSIEKSRNVLEKLIPGKAKYALLVIESNFREQFISIAECLSKKEIGLLVVGTIPDLDLQFAKELSESLNFTSISFYNGSIDDAMKKGIACASDIILLSSESDSDFLEAIACSSACEANGLSGPIVFSLSQNFLAFETLRNGVNGFKVQLSHSLESVDFLSHAIDLILQDNLLHQKISKNALQSIEQPQFKPESFYNWRLKFYENASTNYLNVKTGDSIKTSFKVKAR